MTRKFSRTSIGLAGQVLGLGLVLVGCGAAEVSTLPTTVTQPPITAPAVPSSNAATAPDVVGKRLPDAIEQ